MKRERLGKELEGRRSASLTLTTPFLSPIRRIPSNHGTTSDKFIYSHPLRDAQILWLHVRHLCRWDVRPCTNRPQAKIGVRFTCLNLEGEMLLHRLRPAPHAEGEVHAEMLSL
jgi:hypothetical protein